MKLDSIIGKLRKKRLELDKLIGGLEQLQQAAERQKVARKRRGRKSMAAAEREQVRQRMRRYWAARRERQAQGESTSGEG